MKNIWKKFIILFLWIYVFSLTLFYNQIFRFGHSLLKPNFKRMGGDFSERGRDLKLSDMFFNPDKLYEPGEVSIPVREDKAYNAMKMTSLTSLFFRGFLSPLLWSHMEFFMAIWALMALLLSKPNGYTLKWSKIILTKLFSKSSCPK